MPKNSLALDPDHDGRVRAESEVANPESVLAEDQIAQEVLDLVTELSLELHPHRLGRFQPSLIQDLDEDLGLDSLGRAELMVRLETAFNVDLPDELLTQARTPEDLIENIVRAKPRQRQDLRTEKIRPLSDEIEATPAQISDLVSLLEWHAERHGDREHILLSDGEADGPSITYGELRNRSRKMAHVLREKGLQPGDNIALMLPTCAEFFPVFMGIVYAGGTPVPIYPPHRASLLEEHIRRQSRVLSNAEAVMLVTSDEVSGPAQVLKSMVPTIKVVYSAQELVAEEHANEWPLPPAMPGDMALLQYTSGSTGDPKGVILTHTNILANIRAMGEAMRASPQDRLVTWLPLYHDMGLIGTWLTCLYFAAPVVIMSPLNFLARPERWLWTIHRTSATISVGPNFAFEQCLAKIPDERLQGLDLTSLRVLVDGSEPVPARTIREFNKKFAPYGLREEAIHPGYGLAECAVGLTLPPPDRPARIDRVKKSHFSSTGYAAAATDQNKDVIELVSCGVPLIGHEVRVLDASGHEAGERQEGRLQFRGPSATPGYFRDDEKTRALFDGDWLETGDLAYISEGDVFITGRTKDIIFRAGRNIHPAEVESAVAALGEVGPAGAVLFGVGDESKGTERLVLLIETLVSDEEAKNSLIASADQLTDDLLGLPPDEIVLVPPHTIPRTSSGKIRRLALAQQYERGGLGRKRRTVRWQVASLTLSSLLANVRGQVQAFTERAYAVYWWTAMFALILLCAPIAMALPKSSWRWAFLQRTARLGLGVLGHSLTTQIEHQPPRRDVVFVANHASYLDHVALAAILRGKLSFAAHKELESRPLQFALLKRLDTLFVARFEAAAGVEDTKRALGLSNAGHALVFYPEATATRMPGLLDFRMGAFMVAAKAGIPIVPIAIQGTRSILRHDYKWFPKKGAITVRVGSSIHPEGNDFQAALKLKQSAREFILEHCGEPDLAAEKPRY